MVITFSLQLILKTLSHIHIWANTWLDISLCDIMLICLHCRIHLFFTIILYTWPQEGVFSFVQVTGLSNTKGCQWCVSQTLSWSIWVYSGEVYMIQFIWYFFLVILLKFIRVLNNCVFSLIEEGNQVLVLLYVRFWMFQLGTCSSLTIIHLHL